MKKCSKCGELKPLAEFTRDKSKKSGYKSACKSCLNTPERRAYEAKYRTEHADYFKEYVKNYERERTDRDRETNRASYYRHREERLASAAAYHKQHPEKARAARAKRRAQTRGATVCENITLPELFARDSGVCQLCGGLCDPADYTYVGDVFVAGNFYPSIDHIVPLSRGGGHTWDNVQLAHRRCNSVKSNKQN